MTEIGIIFFIQNLKDFKTQIFAGNWIKVTTSAQKFEWIPFRSLKSTFKCLAKLEFETIILLSMGCLLLGFSVKFLYPLQIKNFLIFFYKNFFGFKEKLCQYFEPNSKVVHTRYFFNDSGMLTKEHYKSKLLKIRFSFIQ